MNIFYKDIYRKKLKSDCSGLGFYLFTTTFAASFIIIIMSFARVIADIREADDNILFFLQAVASIFSFFVIGLLYCKFSRTELNDVIPFKKTDKKTLLLLILVGYSLTFIASHLSALMNFNISLFNIKTDIDMSYDSSHFLTKILFIVSVSIIPALVEEFTFRGIVLGKLRKYGDTFALFLSALLFGLIHGNLQQIPFAFICGLGFGFITIKSNSLTPAIIVHFMNNFVSVLVSILIDNKILSESIVEILYSALMFIALILGIIAVFTLNKRNNYFKLSTNNDILTFREKMKAGLLSVGMIFFNIQVILTTLSYLFNFSD